MPSAAISAMYKAHYSCSDLSLDCAGLHCISLLVCAIMILVLHGALLRKL